MTRDKHNTWLDREAENRFNKWKRNYFKYKHLDWNDAPTQLRSYFKKIILYERQQEQDPQTFRQKQDKLIRKDDKQAMRDIKSGRIK